jgi:hypothetical protein
MQRRTGAGPHEGRPRPERYDYCETSQECHRDVVLGNERGAKELGDLKDSVRIHAAVHRLASPRKTGLEVSKTRVAAAHDLFEELGVISSEKSFDVVFVGVLIADVVVKNVDDLSTAVLNRRGCSHNGLACPHASRFFKAAPMRGQVKSS